MLQKFQQVILSNYDSSFFQFTNFGGLDKILLLVSQYSLRRFHDGAFNFMKEMQFKDEKYLSVFLS